MRKLLVLLVASAVIFTMALPVMAQSTVNLYGSARMETFIQSFDKEQTTLGYDDDDLVWRLDQSSSRFGARFKAGDLAGNVEIRPNSNSVMRHWYGTWNFGSGTLLLGQTWSVSFMPICDECMIGGGGFMSGYGDLGGVVRQGQIRVSFPMKAVNGTLDIAALEPTSNTTLSGTSDTDTTIPRLEAGLSFARGPISGKVVLGYGSFDAVNATDQSKSVDSYFLTANVTGGFGPFWLSLAGGFGQNMKDYGYGGSVFNANLLNNSVNDVDQTRFAGEIGFNVSDTFALFANYAMLSESRDNTAGDDEDEKSMMAFGAKITVAKGFTMTPEIVITDEAERTTNGVKGLDRGGQTYYGIYWQIDF